MGDMAKACSYLFSSSLFKGNVMSGRLGALMEPALEIIRDSIARADLLAIASRQFGDMVKAVVDIDRRIMAIGAELHADEEAALLEDGSAQAVLWGINLYPNEPGDALIEFDSMINVRPSQGNRSRTVENETTREQIRTVVRLLVRDA